MKGFTSDAAMVLLRVHARRRVARRRRPRECREKGGILLPRAGRPAVTTAPTPSRPYRAACLLTS